MTVYLVATLLSCLLAGWAGRQARPFVWQALSALPLIGVAACRWGLGTDFYLTYLPEFRALEWLRSGGGAELADRLFAPLMSLNHVAEWTSPQEILTHFLGVLAKAEPGFRAVLETAVFTGAGFRLVVGVCAVLSGACVFRTIYRESRCPALAVFFFVATSNYFLMLNVMRQYVAIGFLLLGLAFVREGKPLKWTACVVAGALFHYTAILFWPCYGLRRVRLSPVWGFVAVGVALSLSVMAEPVALWVLPKAGLGYYCRYFGDTLWAKDGFEGIFFAINLCFMAASLWYFRRAEREHDSYRIWYWMTVLGTMALALSGTLPLMKRINFYFAAPQFLMLPELALAERRPAWRRLIVVLTVAAFAVEAFIAVVLMNKNEPLPYAICSDCSAD